jgi:hypothetical protein
VLVFYAPIETWVSLPNLLDPYYLVDFIAMVLLGLGVVRSRQGRPASALGFLSGGWGWLGANGWRATADRMEFIADGGTLEYGAAEMCFVVCGTLIAIVGLAWSIRIMTSATSEQQ